MALSALDTGADGVTDGREGPQRLGVFFFFDPDGVVDDYVVTLLEDMNQNLAELVIVSNGPLAPDGFAKLSQFTDNIIVRANEGLDVWAYRTALMSYGWAKLVEFDEVILFNSTIMGPVYPFAEMFAEMDTRRNDFWGLTWFHSVPFDPFGTTPEGYIPRHIQSHFMAYRRSLVESRAFQDYWETMPPIRGYEDSVGMHEAPFTQRFERLGFVSDVYVNTEDMEGLYLHPVLFAPKRLIAERRCPIFKRRSFFHNYEDILGQSVGNATRDLYEYLRDHTDYDTDLIWQNLLRTTHLADLVKGMQLTYVLPSEIAAPLTSQPRTALVLHVYYLDLLEETLGFARTMPEWCDVIVTTDSEEKVAAVEAAAAALPQHVEVRLIENRGRDVSALLIGARDVVDRYEYVCFAHDKKVTQLYPYSKGEGFAVKCFENMFASREFVTNVISQFEREPRLGIMMPTPPNHAEYFPVYSFGWGENFPGARAVVRSLGLDVPMSPDKDVIAPLGTMFWFRSDALRPLFEADWEYSGFPAEPNATDGTLLHAVERAYAYVAQARGYFAAWLFSDSFARIELTNLSLYVEELTRGVANRTGRGTLNDMKAAMALVPGRWHQVKQVIKLYVPPTLHGPVRETVTRVRRIL